MSTLLTLRQDSLGEAVVVTAEGEVDQATAPQLATALATAAAGARRVLAADLDGLRFLGSAGLAVLVTAATEGLPLVVVARKDSVARRALHLTGLDRVLTIAADLDEAMSAPQAETP